MSAEIRITRVTKHAGALLSKRIFCGEDGRPQSDGSPCAMAHGTAMRVRLNGSPAMDLAGEILDLGSHEALVLGDLADGLPDGIRLEKDGVADPLGHVRPDETNLPLSTASLQPPFWTTTRRACRPTCATALPMPAGLKGQWRS